MLRRRSYPRPVASTPGTSELRAIEAEVRTHPHGLVPRDLRRRQLLAVAEQHFVERGYAATSMDDVAAGAGRSEEHTSELQSQMRTSYADFCLKNKTKDIPQTKCR